MNALTEAELLRLWESAAGQEGTARALTLAAGASQAGSDTLLDATIGERDARLLGLHEACFGTELVCEVDCPSCGEHLETELGTATLRMPGPPSTPTRIVVGDVDVTVRPLTSRDALAVDARDSDARRALVLRSVLGSSTPTDDLPDEVVEEIAGALGALDPQADIDVALDCFCCGAIWSAPFEIASFLWLEIDAYVRRLLVDIRALAGAYGWTEAESLAVSPLRRRFYLEAVSV